MDPKMERLNGELMVWCVIPEEDQIKINGDMYGPIKTPHPIAVKEVKLMLFYEKEVKAVDPTATDEEIEAAEMLTLDVLEAAEELFLMDEEAAAEEEPEETVEDDTSDAADVEPSEEPEVVDEDSEAPETQA